MALMAIIVSIVTACGNDDLNDEIFIEQVTLHSIETTTTVITEARVGTLVRIDGTGFASAKAIYVNGIEISINPNYITNNHIILTIPSDLPYGNDVDEIERNVLRIVTKTDEYSFPFVILGPAPVINDVSHSLPQEGLNFEIYGSNLRDINNIIFPGDVNVDPAQFEANEDYTALSGLYPSGASTTPGSIFIDGANGQATSYKYMNQYNGIFIKQFSADPPVDPYGTKSYSYGSNITGTQTTELPVTGSGQKSPEYYRQIPPTISDISLEQNVGGFRFRSDIGLVSVLNTSNGTITADMLCSNLALQFDIYMPVEWSSGIIRIGFNGGEKTLRYDYAPWVISTDEEVPVNMDGWQTVTVPLGALSALTGQTYQDFIDLTKDATGSFEFINGSYLDINGEYHKPSAIEGFQLSFGNFRIVPYTKN